MHRTYCGMPKSTSWAELTSNSVKKLKPVALAVIKLRLSEGISQSVIQLVTQSIIRKFFLIIKKINHINLLKVFQVDLKLVWA